MSIDWKRELLFLKTYQDHHMAIVKIDRDINALTAQLAEVEEDIAQARGAIAEAEQRRADAEKHRKSEELEVESLKARLLEREGKLYAIKTNKEYQTSIKEIAEWKQDLRRRDEQILTWMEAAEAASGEITQLSTAHSDKEAAHTHMIAELQQAEAGLQTARAEEASERSKLEKEIATEVLRAYQRIQTRYDDALAVVVNGMCTGCHMRVPPQRFIELRRGDKMVPCEECRRLLYWLPDEEPAQDVSNGA